MKNKALFLDLDGTLIQTKSENTFGQDKDDWKFRPKMLSRVKAFYDNGYYIVIVSNQAGVDEGYITPRELTSKICLISEQLCNFLKKSTYKYTSWEIGHDDKVFWCISDSFEHAWRKPNPDAAYFVADKFDLDLNQCVMVGDASGLSKEVEITKEEQLYSLFKEFTKWWSDNNGGQILAPGDLPFEGVFTSPLSTLKGRIKVSIKGLTDWKMYHLYDDFSDSDKKFAENAGIGKYYDVEEFVKQPTDEPC